jgi:hypothetical protein
MIDLKKYNLLQIYSLFFKNIFQCKINTDLYLGVFYITLHIIYILLVIYNSFFTYNLTNTCILIVIIYLNFITVFIMRTCPIVLLEKKYINTTYLKCIFFYKNENNINKRDKNKRKKEKEKEKKRKILSKYLNYELDEITLQGLVTLGLILCIKLFIIFSLK